MKYGCVISATKESANSYGTVWEQFSNNCDAKWAWGQLTPQSVQNGYKFEVAIGTSDNTQLMCAPGPSDTGSFFEYCTGTDKGSAVATTDMVDGHKLATAYVYNSYTLDEVPARAIPDDCLLLALLAISVLGMTGRGVDEPDGLACVVNHVSDATAARYLVSHCSRTFPLCLWVDKSPRNRC